MCGIIGIFGEFEPFDTQQPLASLNHRGPDGSGETSTACAWLGHTRLAIIDLSNKAAQPMHDPRWGTIVFNGELYDHAVHRRELELAGHTFRSSSDTEVLLCGVASKGVEFLSRVHGMFAFAWLSADGRRLVLARDHIGMKPLYLRRTNKYVSFASEVRALVALERARGNSQSLNGGSLASFLAWGSVPEPHTIFSGIEMLPAATALTFRTDDLANAKSVAYGYRVPETHDLRGTIRASVARHIVADVPVALFLSGGIDSSIIASELRALGSARVHTISVVTGGHGTHDEPSIARAHAQRLGLQHHEVSASLWQQYLTTALGHYDQPSIDGLNTAVIARVAHELGFRVALSGIGADEVFGGYAHLHLRRHGLPRRLACVTNAFSMSLAWLQSPRVRRARILAESVSEGIPLQLAWRRILGPADVRNLLPHTSEQALPLCILRERDPLVLEQKTYLLNTLLRDTDVMGMAQGLEIRAPFLDREVLAFARRAGTSKVLRRGRSRKWMLRDTWAADIDPRSRARPKSGFTLSLRQWLDGAAKPLLAEAHNRLEREGFMARAALRLQWRSAEEAMRRNELWGSVLLFAFLQLYRQTEQYGPPR